jgi:hypothetical protein
VIREDRSSGARRAKRCWSRQPFLRVPCRRELADQEYKRSPLPASAKVSQPKLCYSTTQAERSPLKHVGFPSTGNSRNSSGSTTTLRTLQPRLTRICLVSSLANLTTSDSSTSRGLPTMTWISRPACDSSIVSEAQRPANPAGNK